VMTATLPMKKMRNVSGLPAPGLRLGAAPEAARGRVILGR
jgi:hypothetical protein